MLLCANYHRPSVQARRCTFWSMFDHGPLPPESIYIADRMRRDMRRSSRMATLAGWLLLGLSVTAARTDRVLVLLEDMSLRSTHSGLFAALAAQGAELTFTSADARDLTLREWDDWQYDQAVVMGAGISEFGGEVSGTALLDFVDSGHDLLMAVDTGVSDELRELAADVGVDLEAPTYAVTDHFHMAEGGIGSSGLDPTAITTRQVARHAVLLGGRSVQGPVVFKGIGATISPESMTALPALQAEDTAYSAVPGKPGTDVLAAGKELTLVSAVQARNNARVAVLGSIAMCSNAAFAAQGRNNSNRALCEGIASWTFHKAGVLRASPLRHRVAGSSQWNPAQYRINDDIEFEVDIHEFRDGRWQPHKADDVQMEFVMLDPYVRSTLAHNGQGTFSTFFKAPDTYGVFKFVLEHRRPGWTMLEESVQVPVWPFRHNEYDRFLPPAYPYYVSAFSGMAAFFVLGLVFLYSK